MRAIFHHPRPLYAEAVSGSGVRPARMLDAFRQAGVEMDVIAGTPRERVSAMRSVLARLDAGERYEFCYSETSTLPAALTGRNHLPFRGEFDIRFFKQLKRRGVPVGVFYRDAQWRLRSESSRPIERLKHRVSGFFHRHELAGILNVADIVYVPNPRFATWLGLDPARAKALPPGCSPISRADSTEHRVSVLYVGGVVEPIYDISSLLDTARGLPKRTFRIVCRAREWERISSILEIPPNVHAVSATSENLDEYFRESELFGLLVGPTEYFSVASPVKLFEALGRGLPVVALAGTASADFVRSEGIGWIVDTAAEASALIEALITERRGELEAVAGRMPLVALRHTWVCRATTVIDDLAKGSIGK